MRVKHHQKPEKKNFLYAMSTMKADALTGFIAGFLAGVIGMYIYVVIASTFQ